MLFSFFLAIITLVCLVPAVTSVFYLVLGIKTWIIGRKERNSQKTSGGIYSVTFAVLGLIACYLFWRFLITFFFRWEL